MSRPQEVRVLVKGIYNDENHRSLGWSEVGDVIVVAGGPYGDSLIEDGLCEPFDERSDRLRLEAELEELSARLDAADSFSGEEIAPVLDGPADNSATEILLAATAALEAPPAAPVSKSRRTQRLS
jgi:hypothetical protein